MSLELSRMCTAIAPSPTLAIDAKAKEMRLNGRDVVSFSVGEPDFVTPQYIRTAAHEALDMGLTKYTPAPGTIGLRKAICEKLLSGEADFDTLCAVSGLESDDAGALLIELEMDGILRQTAGDSYAPGDAMHA